MRAGFVFPVRSAIFGGEVKLVGVFFFLIFSFLSFSDFLDRVNLIYSGLWASNGRGRANIAP